MFDMKQLNADILAGGLKIQKKTLEPFNDEICQFLTSFSQKLISSKETRKFTDLIALAFWCSKKNVQNLKKKFSCDDLRTGKGLIFHITPSNVPTNFFYSLMFGLLSGNSNIVKVPSNNFDQIRIICDQINQLLNLKKFKNLKKIISIIRYKKDNIDNNNKILSINCDQRIIWGGDKTINKIREYKLSPHANDITFGDRYSISLINLKKLENTNNKELDKLVRSFYNDTYLVDQNACSSPHLILWYGKENMKVQTKFWNKLKEKVDKSYDIPMNAVTEKYTKFCEDMTNDYFLHGKTYGQGIYVVRLKKIKKSTEKLRGKWGYFYEYTIKDLNEFCEFITKKFQTISYYGFEKKYFENYFKSHFVDGVDRIVPIGSGLNIDLIWDGYDIIKTLSKVKNIE